jgi:uncharacterized protein
MKRTEAITALKGQAYAVKAFGGTALYLFGSTARDSATIFSDLDLFIDYDLGGRFSLIELVGIKQLLEHRLGVLVDLTTRDSLAPPSFAIELRLRPNESSDGAACSPRAAGHPRSNRRNRQCHSWEDPR